MESLSFKKQNTVNHYRRAATYYDEAVSYLSPIRKRAIQALCLQRGQVVLDVACGTGLSFEGFQESLQGEGQIIGIEENQQMIEVAHQRIKERGWKNITLIHSTAEKACLSQPVDAVLFHFTHDVLQSSVAVKNIFQFVNSGARVVSAGMKWASPWCSPMNLYPYFKARAYITSFDGFQKPWGKIEPFLEHSKVESFKVGVVYLLAASAHGRKVNLNLEC